MTWLRFAGAMGLLSGLAAVPAISLAQTSEAGQADGVRADAEASGASARRAQGQSKPSAAAIREALAHFAREPSVAQVVRAALAIKDQRDVDLRNMASRARMTGWVPSFRLSARRGQTVDLSSTQTDADERLRVSTDDDLTLQGALLFDFGKLMFAREEVAIAREGRNAAHSRNELVREVVAVYFQRRRLQLELRLGLGDALAQRLGIAQAEALLNAFTENAFRRMLKASRR